MRSLVAVLVLVVASRSLADDELTGAAPARPPAYGIEAAGTAGLSGAWDGRLGLVIVRGRTRFVFEGESLRARAVHPEMAALSGIGSTAVRFQRLLDTRSRRVELDAGLGLGLLGLFVPRTERFTFVPEVTGRFGAGFAFAGPLRLDAIIEAGLPAAVVDTRAGVVLRSRAFEVAARWREYHRLWRQPIQREWEIRGVEIEVTWIPGRYGGAPEPRERGI